MSLEFPEVQVHDHPLLAAGLIVTELPAPLGELGSPDWLLALHAPDADAPLARDEDLRGEVRKLLRHGGYKPSGRGKPSSEYLVRAATEGALGSINLCVDLCNAVSLHSGLPISVVDLDLAVAPYTIRCADPDSSYVFNASGQEIRIDGLLNLFDAGGPCANAVKDSQRTKTHDGTRRTLSVLWGTSAYPERTHAALEWYAELLERAGAAAAGREA